MNSVTLDRTQPTAQAIAQADDSALLTFAQVAAELPPRRNGRPTSPMTLYRWANEGYQGIYLEYRQVGSIRMTTRRWIGEFFDALTERSKADRRVKNPAE